MDSKFPLIQLPSPLVPESDLENANCLQIRSACCENKLVLNELAIKRSNIQYKHLQCETNPTCAIPLITKQPPPSLSSSPQSLRWVCILCRKVRQVERCICPRQTKDHNLTHHVYPFFSLYTEILSSHSNARHPTHNHHDDVNIQYESDEKMLDRVLHAKDHATHDLEAVSEETEEKEEPLQKVSAWIYPKLHQEIYIGRPTDFMGGCGCRLEEASHRSPNSPVLKRFPLLQEREAQYPETRKQERTPNSNLVHEQAHHEREEWRPAEWLVDHRLSSEPPESPVRDQVHCSHPMPPPPIHIEGSEHPVANSPFRSCRTNTLASPHHCGLRAKIEILGHPVQSSPFLH